MASAAAAAASALVATQQQCKGACVIGSPQKQQVLRVAFLVCARAHIQAIVATVAAAAAAADVGVIVLAVAFERHSATPCPVTGSSSGRL